MEIKKESNTIYIGVFVHPETEYFWSQLVHFGTMRSRTKPTSERHDLSAAVTSTTRETLAYC